MFPILTFQLVNGDSISKPTSIDLGQGIYSLDQASKQLPEGAYTTFRTYPGLSALHLIEHFQRLEDSLAIAGYGVSLHVDIIMKQIRTILSSYPNNLARVRITVPFGLDPAIIYISVGALSVPTPDDFMNGVKVLTTPFFRERPKAKLSGFISSSSELRKSIPKGIEEILMVDGKGNLLEGLTSNFFAVIDRTIFTADEGVLNGITRKITLSLAREAEIKVELTPPNQKDILKFDETFITSTSRAILPVTMINSKVIGTGKPGLLTGQLIQWFDARVKAEIKPI